MKSDGGASVSAIPFVDEILSARAPAATMEEHRRSIADRQARIPKLWTDENRTVGRLGGQGSRGCSAGLQNRWIAVFVGQACNLSCTFCPQPPKPQFGSNEDGVQNLITSFGHHMSMDKICDLLVRAVQDDRIDAVAYSGGEPFMYIDRIEHIAMTLKAVCPDIYQYVYTNGTYLSSERLSRLRAAGVTEVRIDLAASDFSPGIIKKISTCRSIMEYIVVESPATLGISKKIKASVDLLVSSRVDQINLCEMVINRYNYGWYAQEPFYIFNPYDVGGWMTLPDGADRKPYRRLVPVWSRPEAYSVLEDAEEEGWPLVIQEVSQGFHYKSSTPI